MIINVIKNILEWLEFSAERFPDKTVFTDEANAVTYSDFLNRSRAGGSFLCRFHQKNRPVALLLPRGVAALQGMMSVVYSGNFYVVLDVDMPEERMRSILQRLQPFAMIADESHQQQAEHLLSGKVIVEQELWACSIDRQQLLEVRERMIDTDPLYALFTSGSTGKPKGAIVCHRNVIAYIDWFTKAFRIDSDTVFGSQTPLYFSMSVSDVFSTLCMGATLHLLAKKLFSFPMQLVEYLNTHSVNTIYWVPSALCLLANWKIFNYCEAKYLKKILFAGEAMPTRQLNYWIANLPDALYANLFGPTETTDICTYYILSRKLADDEPVPMGRACNNCDVFVLKEDGTPAVQGEEGELYVRGSFVVPGYYEDPEKTASAFVQNPLNPHYPEIVYRTGDIVRYDRFGDLEYVGRKDFQIKHMGYRIELGEIEAAAAAIEKVAAAAVLYDLMHEQIVLVYQAKKLTDTVLMEKLKSRLPDYMMPGRLIALPDMPHNANGKIDRVLLKNTYLNSENK